MNLKTWAAMTVAQRREKVARLCGWEQTPQGLALFKDGHYKKGLESLPDYLNDLNAMHDAEDQLFSPSCKGASNQERQYYRELYDAVSGECFTVCRAPAHIRAFAFVMALEPEG